MNASTPVNYFRALYDYGYTRLVPILPMGVSVTERTTLNRPGSHGKAVGIRGSNGLWFSYDWVTYENDEDDLERWHRMQADIGIKCGQMPDGTWFLFLDADTKNPELAAIIEQHVEAMAPGLPKRIGQAPKAAFPIRVSGEYRYSRIEFGERNAKGELSDRFEVLTEGRQCKVRGIHPDTGEPYYWPRKLMPFHELPVVTPQRLTQFMDDLRAVLPAASEVKREGSSAVVNQESLRGDPDLVRKAVSLIPNTSERFPTRDTYRDLGYAIKAALPDDEPAAFALFEDWCERWEDGENDPKVVASDWRRMKPPFRRGASWLFDLAAAAAPDQFSKGEQWFEADPDVSEFPSLPEGGGSVAARPKLQLQSFDDVAATALTISSHPLVDDLLDQRAMTVLYGESNTGKTFVAMDLAYHVASGLPWGGMRTEQHAVVYIAAEGGAGARKRAAALRSKYGPCPGFLYLLSPVNLLDPNADLGPLIDLLKGVDRLGLIVLDTLSRVLAGGDENSSIDMGALVRHFDAIRAATDAHLLVVHHTGKKLERGARGHSLLRAATDTEIEISEGKIRVTKQRDMEKFSEAAFGLETVVLGQNARGKDITSCTVGLLARGSVEAGELTDREAEVLRAVTVVLARAVAPAKGVRSAAIASELGEAGDDGANRVRGHLNKLVSKNRLVKLDRGLWLPRDIHAATYFEAIDPPEETPKNLGKTLATEAPQNSRPQTTLLDPSGGVFA
ncbi:hypothetical protein ASG51_00915 [Methylobacterium sp. Leaf465]|uniref:AAA family ATPase n=1 Tax=Methylobacterium sp. Leaf465 TaxID=1736385 RepID=UPI0006F6D0AF|nr:AAA family ATPase [Methylobacterium sp. Leaf465]KQT84686.1 hypothetical protein ASG51_00915 [Methylobacterium sp. Leaf465]